MTEYFEELGCPVCGPLGETEVCEADDNMQFNSNYNCYERKLYCTCHRCNTDFTVKELWDAVGFDPDSVKIMK